MTAGESFTPKPLTPSDAWTVRSTDSNTRSNTGPVDRTEKGGAGDDSSSQERAQNPRLTLLDGGARRNLPVNSTGAPVPTTLPTPILRDVSRHDPPLRRYKAPPSGPPLWSARAGWLDLTTRWKVPAPSPTMSGDLTAGWSRRWDITYRHGRNDYTAKVAHVGEADLFASDPIRVNSWHKGKTSRAGLRFMEATGRLHAHESMFERKLLCALDFHGAADVLSQPFTLTWHDGTRERNHTPDFMARIDGDIVIINTRPALLVKDRLLDDCTAIGEVAMSRGWGHALVVGYRTEAFATIDAVSAHSDTPDHLGYTDDILDLLDDSGPAAFADVCNALSSPIMGRAVLQRLIWERQVSLDLSVALEDHTLVALPGDEVRP